MIYLENSNTNPAINHAIEEYFLHETNLEVFSLWQNETCLLLGKNQDAKAELNLSFIREKKNPRGKKALRGRHGVLRLKQYAIHYDYIKRQGK